MRYPCLVWCVWLLYIAAVLKIAKLIYRRVGYARLINRLCIKCIYNYFIMTIADWAGLILTILSIIAALGIGARWIIRHYLKDILHEVKPNSGQSIKDQVTRLEAKINKLEDQQLEADKLRKETNKKIDHMYDLFIEYLTKNSQK